MKARLILAALAIVLFAVTMSASAHELGASFADDGFTAGHRLAGMPAANASPEAFQAGAGAGDLLNWQGSGSMRENAFSGGADDLPGLGGGGAESAPVVGTRRLEWPPDRDGNGMERLLKIPTSKVIPEPGSLSLALLGLAMIALGVWIRYKVKDMDD